MLRRALSERDLAVIQRVAEHRYLTTAQLQQFVFSGLQSAESAARTTRRVLARLRDSDLLRSLDRRIGGLRAGSAGTVWQVSPAGARVLWEAEGHRTHEPSPRFLAHCLGVANAHLGLLALRQMDQVESVRVTVEGAAWRRYTGSGGELRHLKPDLAAVIQTEEFEDRWFAEVDCGTESIPTLVRKCEQYEAYRATGIEQHRYGAFPLVLWLLEGRRSLERTERLSSTLARSSRFTPAMYRYGNIETLGQIVGGLS